MNVDSIKKNQATESPMPSAVELYASIGLMLDIEEEEAQYHCWRVALVSYHLSERLSSFESPLVFVAGLLADAGAIHFDSHISRKLIEHPSVISQKGDIDLFFHPLLAYEALRRLPGLRRIGELVGQHHECHNGSGYPAGLSGEDIDLGAQILRIADHLDLVLRTEQPGNSREVLQSMQPFAGEDFSSDLLDALGDLLSENMPLGRLTRMDWVASEVDRICNKLAGIRFFEGEADWERTMQGLGRLIDTRYEFYGQGHCGRVAELSDRIATEMGQSKEQRRLIRWSSHLQNMGEVALYRCLLSKTKRIEEGEIEWIHRHPVVGCDLISRVRGMDEVARIVRNHHENWDGSGYPDGLALAEIHPAARIIRVADTFDAMISGRPYKRKKDWKKAVGELKKLSGRHYDPEVVDAAIATLQS